MTEAEWLGSADLEAMLAFLRGKCSDRKFRLFAVACCRRMWFALTDKCIPQSVETAEAFADGDVSRKKLREAWQQADNDFRAAHRQWSRERRPESGPYYVAVASCEAFRTVSHAQAHQAASHISSPCAAAVAGREYSDHRNREEAVHVRLLRELLGPLLFRPFALARASLSWNDRVVVKLAEGIYAERAFDRLPILADALEDAGCANADILHHCRGDGEHVRGCWVVDALLGKE